MLKQFLKYLLAVTLGFTSLGLASLHYLGLDDDGPESVDTALETRWDNEEIGFDAVATVIKGFVRRQFDIRSDSKNIALYEKERSRNRLGKYSRVYQDLPGKSAYATRDVHRKTHGCFKAELEIDSGLFSNFNSVTQSVIAERQAAAKGGKDLPGPMPELLSDRSDLGVFQPGMKLDSIVRLSNGHPGNRDDKFPDARGFAVKILGVKDPAFGTSEVSQLDAGELNSQTALDILSINFPTFFVNEKDTAKKYLTINEYFLSSARDFSNPLLNKAKEALSIFASGMNPLEIRTALRVNGSVIANPLHQSYYSMVPSRLGRAGSARAVKYYWQPEACPEGRREWERDLRDGTLAPWTQQRHFADPIQPLAKRSTPPYEAGYPEDYLRHAASNRMMRGDFCYGLYFQPYRDQVSTNIEDSTDVWLGAGSMNRESWERDVFPGNSSLEGYVPGYRAFADAYLAKLRSKKEVKSVRAGTLRLERALPGVDTNTKTCEDLSFNPWNGNIEMHKPLGVISRLKRRVYNSSRNVRHVLNGIKSWSLERR